MGTYSFTPGFVAEWLVSGLFSLRRSFAADARRAFSRYQDPHVEGGGHVPATGPFIVVSNHYQRRGIGAWWTALAISAAVGERRPDAAIRWMHTNRFGGYRLLGLVPVPEAWMAWLLRWGARRYDFLLVARDEIGPRAPMLRDAHRSLHQAGRPVGIMPEAGNAVDGGVLGPAPSRAGPALAWLSAGRVPVLPVAVWAAEDGRLEVRFGATFTMARTRGDGDADLTTMAMRRVAEMLPASLRGVYAEAVR